jgi:hypothetical protein
MQVPSFSRVGGCFYVVPTLAMVDSCGVINPRSQSSLAAKIPATPPQPPKSPSRKLEADLLFFQPTPPPVITLQ